MNPLYQKHIISINDLSREELELVLETAAKLKANPQPELLKHKVIASCFFEASTRTRLSFETSMHRLGASVVGFSDSSNTSLGKKGETLADTISVISTYVDAIVMRHPQEQYLPIFLERILLFQQFMVAFQETFLLALVQFLEPRTQAGGTYPVNNGLVRAHFMEIGCPPDIHVTARLRQDVVIGMHTRERLTAAVRVVLLQRHFTHRYVSGFKPVVRHLDR